MSFPQFTATSKLAEALPTASTLPATVQSSVRAFNTLVTNLQQIFTALLGQVQLDSVVLQGVTLIAGTNQIPHTLGRTWTGCIPISLSAACSLYQPQPQPNPGTYLTIVSNAACTASFEVY